MITGEDLIDPIIKMSIFKMKKTNKPDAYDLLDISTGKKIDIAIIPDMQTSKKCKKWYSSNKTDILHIKCQFIFDKKKWLPIEIVFEEELLNITSSKDNSTKNKPIDTN